MEPIPESVEAIASEVLNAAFRVHRGLGPGLLESVYEKCLGYELQKSGLRHTTQEHLPVRYDGRTIDAGLRLDVFVEGSVIVELKSVDALLAIHEAQLLTYLKMTKARLGFLMNFNSVLLKDGIKRLAL